MEIDTQPTPVPDSIVDGEAPSVSASSPAIAVRGLSKRYRRTAVLKDLSFSVPRGCICGFLGANGAGKTTTLRVLMGLLPADSGCVRVLGLDPAKAAFELRQRIGYVPDVSHVYQWMSVKEAFRFVAGVYRAWDAVQWREMCELLALPMDRLVKQLSRGELAKLNLIIAMSHRPELLIMDEPTTGLDPLVRDEFLDAVLQLSHARGTTVLFSTHILADVDRTADRLVVMNDGRAIAEDSMEALRSRYSKASFLFQSPPPLDLELPGALRVRKGIREWVAVFAAMDAAGLHAIARRVGAQDVLTQPMSVEDVFLEIFDHNAAGV